LLPVVVLDFNRGLLITSGRVGMLPEICLLPVVMWMLPEVCLLPAIVLECYQRSSVCQQFFMIVTIEVIWLPAVVSVVATNSVFLFPTSFFFVY
jgi:hypothetical protein